MMCSQTTATVWPSGEFSEASDAGVDLAGVCDLTAALAIVLV